jgi:hypothetical protein
MSKQYPGGIISKTAPVPSGAFENSTAPGVWTLEQQAYWQKLGQWPTAGNTNPSAFIENLFSTYLYTGTGAAQTITNGIDLSTNGGLVWTKCRSNAANNALFDTGRGTTKYLSSNLTNAQATEANGITAFGTTGYTFGNNYDLNESTFTYASWTFRKQPKFFDIVTYTGNGTSGRAIPHNLGSAPGFIAVKVLSAVDNWECYHRGITFNSANVLWLNSSNALTTGGARFTSQPTSTDFYVGSDSGVNGSGQTYVAYLFAHDAGGFGVSGTDNVISCGSFTTNGSGNATVNLGYEPQWLMIKETSGTGQWWMQDTMRGFTTAAANGALLEANTADAEIAGAGVGSPTATGFTISGQTGSATHIYIAIRRGPMAVPTVGTSVFAPVAYTGNNTNYRAIQSGFTADAFWYDPRNITGYGSVWFDRLRGAVNYLITGGSRGVDAEATYATYTALDTNNGWKTGNNPAAGDINSTGTNLIAWMLQRAPGFFDEVCYTGTGSATTQTHNLGAVPELVIWKRRSSTSDWRVWQSSFSVNDGVYLNLNFAKDTISTVQTAIPTATVLNLSTGAYTNASGSTYVAYMFATVAGVSKVGSYTGTGTTAQINCGFTTGARFVLIKRTDSTGDWYVWDSARGIVAGNDPYLLLNSDAAEVTGTDYVDTYSAGFEISSTAPAAINANGGTFIFLAIA